MNEALKNVCESSDSNLITSKCWCADCKDVRKLIAMGITERGCVTGKAHTPIALISKTICAHCKDILN